MMALNTLLKQRFYSQQLLKRVAEPTTGPGLAKQLNTDEMPIKMCPLDTFLAGRTDTMVASNNKLNQFLDEYRQQDSRKSLEH